MCLRQQRIPMKIKFYPKKEDIYVVETTQLVKDQVSTALGDVIATRSVVRQTKCSPLRASEF